MSVKIDVLIAIGCLFMLQSSAQQVTYCPGDVVSVSCAVSSPLQWTGTAMNDQCPTNSNGISVIQHDTVTTSIGEILTCGVFTATVTNITTRTVGPLTAAVISSTLNVTATSSLNGTNIVCRTGIFIMMTVSLSVQGEIANYCVQRSLTSVSK